MTNKARELLERTAEILELLFEGPNDVDPNTLAMLGDTRLEEIRAYLADTNLSETINSQEVDRSEPVAWFSPTSKTFSTVETSHHTAPLFLHHAPRPEFVRLSEEEVSEILSSAHTPYEAVCAVENRLVEKNK